MKASLILALASILASPGLAPADAPTVPLERESLSAGLRPFESVADWAERAGAMALGARAPGDDPALLAELGLSEAPADRLPEAIRARALDLAWRVVEHPDATPLLRNRAAERVRALLPRVPPNEDPALARTYRALVVIARSSEVRASLFADAADPARGALSRATFGDAEIARLRRDLAETAAKVFEYSRGVLRIDLAFRVVESEPFRSFSPASSREYGRKGVVPDLDAAAARRSFVDVRQAALDGYSGVFLFVKYEGTSIGPPIPSPSDGHGGALRVALEDGAGSVAHLAYGTFHYRSRAAAWFGRTGFLHEWYHGLVDLAELVAPKGTRIPDNHSVWLHSRDGKEERLLSEDEPEFYRVVLGEMFPPRLLRAAAGDR